MPLPALLAPGLPHAAPDLTGVAFACFPTDGTLPMEIGLSPDTGGGAADTSQEVIARLDPGEQVFVYHAPPDGIRRWARLRHVGAGVDPSPWTAWTSGVPIVLPKDDATLRAIADTFSTALNDADDITDGATKRITTHSEADGGGRAYGTIDSGGVVVSGGIDLSRPYTGKHLGNVPDDPGSDRHAATATEKSGGAKANTAIDAGGVVVAAAVDFGRPYTGKHLGNIPDDTGSDRHAATSTEKTGGARANTAIDAGGVLVPGAIDLARGYTNKHLGNVPDDPTSDRRAATANEKTGGARGYSALDAGNILVPTALDFSRGYTNKHAGNLPRAAGGVTVDLVVGGLDDDGSLLPNTKQSDGVALRPLTKGVQSFAAAHNATLTYAPAFQDVPLAILRGGILYEPRAKWGANGDGSESGAFNTALPIYEDLVLLNPTASGSRVRARLRQPGVATARSEDFPSGNALTAQGQATAATLTHAPARDDTYTGHYSVALTATPDPSLDFSVTIVVGLDSWDGVGWTERGVKSYSASGRRGVADSTTWSSEFLAATVGGMDTTTANQFRLHLKSVDTTGTGGETISVHGFDGGAGDGGAHGLTYTTAADQFACKTPDAADTVRVDLLSVS